MSENESQYSKENILPVPSMRTDGLTRTQLGSVRLSTCLRVNGVYRPERNSSVSKLVRAEQEAQQTETQPEDRENIIINKETSQVLETHQTMKGQTLQRVKNMTLRLTRRTKAETSIP